MFLSHDLLIALLLTAAYFVCETLPMLHDVIRRTRTFQPCTDESRTLKGASHIDTSIAHDDNASHRNLLLPVHHCRCSHCDLSRYTPYKFVDQPIDEKCSDVIKVWAHDRVIVTYCEHGHRQHAGDCETRYDDEE